MFKTKKFKWFVVMAIVAMIAIAATPSTLRRNVWNQLQYFKQGLYVGTSNQFKVAKDGDITSGGGALHHEIPLQALTVVVDYYDTGMNTPAPAIITTSTAPGLVYASGLQDAPGWKQSGLGLETISWSDGEGDPVEYVFPVPPTYTSGGAFKAVVGQAAAVNDSHRNYIKYSTMRMAPGRMTGSLTENFHTVVVVPFSADLNRYQTVTLAVVSDDALSPNNVVAGGHIRLKIWRYDTDHWPGADGGDNVGTSTGDLHLLRLYWDPSA